MCNKLCLPDYLKGWDFFLIFQSLSGLPVVHIIFWFKTYSIIRSLSFFSTWVWQMIFFFFISRITSSRFVSFYFLNKKFLDMHYTKFRRCYNSIQMVKFFFVGILYRLRNHWSIRRNWEGLFCHMVMRSGLEQVIEFQPVSIISGSGIDTWTVKLMRALFLTFVATIGNDAKSVHFCSTKMTSIICH